MKKMLDFIRWNAWRKMLCVLCILGCCSFAVHAQKKVTGTVTDVAGFFHFNSEWRGTVRSDRGIFTVIS
jgi:hypothetical protein